MVYKETQSVEVNILVSQQKEEQNKKSKKISYILVLLRLYI